MDFFNKIGDIANKTYQKTSQKTEEIAKEAKMKIKMNENKNKINDLYEDIGKIVYKKYLNSEEIKISDDLNTYCKQIEELSKEIEKYQEDVLKLKSKRICENCYTEIDLKAKYCPHCGFEQSNEEVEDINTEDNDKSTENETNNEEKAD